MAPLPLSAGGWEQIANGYTSMQDADYQHMAQLVEASLIPLNFIGETDAAGRPHPKSGVDWVKDAEEDYRKKIIESPTGDIFSIDL